jgi:hypothetical protein
MRRERSALVLVTISLLLAAAPFTAVAQGVGGSTAVTGTIVSIDGTTYVVRLDDGTQKTVVLRDNAIILDRLVTTADQIRVGDALGVAARLDNGKLVATSINVFAPEMWEGVRKGQFPMQTGEVMTNAMTAEVVQNSQGRVLTLKLDMATATIVVPDGIPIHRLVSVKPDQLAVGLKVTFRTVTDSGGHLTASGVTFDQATRG